MEGDDAVAEQFHHLDRIFRAEVGGPEGVHLEFHLRTEFGVDLVFQASVDAFEFPVVVVLEEHQTGFFESFLHFGDFVGGAFDRVEVFVIVRAVAADDAVEAETSGDVDGFGEVVRLGPGRMRTVEFESEVIDPLQELFRGHAPEAGRFDCLEADVGDGLKDGVEVFFRHLAERIKLDGQISCHIPFSFSYGLVKGIAVLYTIKEICKMAID
ncbi:hypothetical protein SDC9_185166 [bioreactor metagenome]|uniref:Uncharacterized protein n=1 Tax=bioreactor metagenome TaxID=1076179 RepID=A0A645HGE9_9ZZZZ